MMAGQRRRYIYSVSDGTLIAHTLDSETAHIHAIICIGIVIVITVKGSADLLSFAVANGSAGRCLDVALPRRTRSNTIAAQTFTSDAGGEVSCVHGFMITGDR